MTINQNVINKQGFSLIEVLFSMVLFTIGIFAVVSLINQNMASSMNRRNEVIAGQLAQEGIELVRNIRDNNWLKTPPVDAFTGIQSGRIDYAHANSVESSSDYDLHVNGDGLYEYGSGGIFKRKIIVNGSGDEIIVTSIVTWGDTDPDVVNCESLTKCFYTEVALNKSWGKQ
jgi:prepilin-type N-terminal cleavage/methylation domain-containing protein